MNKNFFTEHAKQIASLFAVVALLLFVPASITESKAGKIFLAVLIALFLIAGIAIFYIGIREESMRRNYFLTAENGKKIPFSALTPRLLCDRIDQYLAPFTDTPAALFALCPQRLKMKLGEEPHFRPLVAWRVLAALSALPAAQILQSYREADERTLAFWCRSLAGAGDKKMADYLFALSKEETEETKIVAFFRKNKACFESRMMQFTEENIRLFDLSDDAKESGN